MSKTKQEIVEHLVEAEKAKKLADDIGEPGVFGRPLGEAQLLPDTAAGQATRPNRVALAVCAIMGEMHSHPLQKRGVNTAFGKPFSYITIDDLNNYLQPYLAKHNLMLLTGITEIVPPHEGTKTLTIRCSMRFIHGPSGDVEQETMMGQSMNPGDKGAYAAFSGCFKYFVQRTFCIPVGNDADTDADGPDTIEHPAPAPRQINPSTDWAAVIQAAVESKGLDWEKSLSFMRSQGADPFSMTQDVAKGWIARIEKGPSKKSDESKAE
jgi:hypothetical protein